MNENLETLRPKSLHRAFIRASKMHKKVCQHRFQQLGLTEGQPKVLDYLRHHNGCSQKDLAKHCHIQPATATSLLGHLERSGLIYREMNQQDRRITNVFLTEAGAAFQKKVKTAFIEIDEQCFKGFTSKEKEEAINYLERICENLKGKESHEDV
ncbi:MAG: MarR family transcriptional regulator [Turicibacter sp.]|nr:MarR family transcriptional regulator [Turicibacter sp.]